MASRGWSPLRLVLLLAIGIMLSGLLTEALPKTTEVPSISVPRLVARQQSATDSAASSGAGSSSASSSSAVASSVDSSSSSPSSSSSVSDASSAPAGSSSSALASDSSSVGGSSSAAAVSPSSGSASVPTTDSASASASASSTGTIIETFSNSTMSQGATGTVSGSETLSSTTASSGSNSSSSVIISITTLSSLTVTPSTTVSNTLSQSTGTSLPSPPPGYVYYVDPATGKVFLTTYIPANPAKHRRSVGSLAKRQGINGANAAQFQNCISACATTPDCTEAILDEGTLECRLRLSPFTCDAAAFPPNSSIAILVGPNANQVSIPDCLLALASSTVSAASATLSVSSSSSISNGTITTSSTLSQSSSASSNGTISASSTSSSLLSSVSDSSTLSGSSTTLSQISSASSSITATLSSSTSPCHHCSAGQTGTLTGTVTYTAGCPIESSFETYMVTKTAASRLASTTGTDGLPCYETYLADKTVKYTTTAWVWCHTCTGSKWATATGWPSNFNGGWHGHGGDGGWTGPELGGRPGAAAVPLAAQDDSIPTGAETETPAAAAAVAAITGAEGEADPSATPTELGPGAYISGASAQGGELGAVRAMLAVMIGGVAAVLVL